MKLLSGPQQKFCEGIVSGLNQTEAYRAAYPKAAPDSARNRGAQLFAKDCIKAEIARQRALAASQPGSAVLTLAEKRNFLARAVRANLLQGEVDGDLIQEISDTEHGRKIKLAGKLEAIKLDNDLAGEGSEAKGNDALTAMLSRVMGKARGANAAISDSPTETLT